MRFSFPLFDPPPMASSERCMLATLRACFFLIFEHCKHSMMKLVEPWVVMTIACMHACLHACRPSSQTIHRLDVMKFQEPLASPDTLNIGISKNPPKSHCREMPSAEGRPAGRSHSAECSPFSLWRVETHLLTHVTLSYSNLTILDKHDAGHSLVRRPLLTRNMIA